MLCLHCMKSGAAMAAVLVCVAITVTRVAIADHLNKTDVATLVAECEVAREAALAPLREQAVSDCIARELKSAAECTRFYADFGNHTTARPRLMPPLPACDEAAAADKHFRLYPP